MACPGTSDDSLVIVHWKKSHLSSVLFVSNVIPVALLQFMITGGNLEDSKEALKLAETRGNNHSDKRIVEQSATN